MPSIKSLITRLISYHTLWWSALVKDHGEEHFFFFSHHNTIITAINRPRLTVIFIHIICIAPRGLKNWKSNLNVGKLVFTRNAVINDLGDIWVKFNATIEYNVYQCEWYFVAESLLARSGWWLEISKGREMFAWRREEKLIALSSNCIFKYQVKEWRFYWSLVCCFASLILSQDGEADEFHFFSGSSTRLHESCLLFSSLFTSSPGLVLFPSLSTLLTTLQ